MPKVYLYWRQDPVPHAIIEDGWGRSFEKAVLSRLLERAAERGLLPAEARSLAGELWYELAPDVLLLPLREGEGDRLRPETAAFVRTHLLLSPPELFALVRGKPADLSRFAPRYRQVLEEEAARWREFLAGETDVPPGSFDVVIPQGPDLERWLELVITSPLFPRALREVRERIEQRKAREAEEARIRALEGSHAVRLVWSPVRRFPVKGALSYEATVEGTAEGRHFTATFEVSDQGLAVRLPEGRVHRDPKGVWRWQKNRRPLRDEALQAFLEVAYARMPWTLKSSRSEGG